MEKLPFQNNKVEGEFVPLEDARFLDRLEPKYEQQWEELIEAATELEVDLIQFAIPLWRDETYPAAIRDRAMLLLTDKQSPSRWYEAKWRLIGRIFFQGHNRFDLDHVKGDEDKFRIWLDEALDCGDIIDHKVLCALSYRFFERGDWDQIRFEQTLEQLEPNIAQRAWDSPIEDGYGHSFGTLPYIHDILHGYSVGKSDIRLKHWAQEKHKLFRQNFVIHEENLPTWLQDLNHAQVSDEIKNIHQRIADDDMLSPHIIAIYEKYGLDFWRGKFHDMIQNRPAVIKHLGEFSKQAIQNYIKACYVDAIEHFPSRRLQPDEESALLSYLQHPIPDALVEYAAILNKKRQEDEERRTAYLLELAKKKAEQRKRDEALLPTKLKQQAAANKKDAEAKNRYRLAQEAFRNLNQ